MKPQRTDEEPNGMDRWMALWALLRSLRSKAADLEDDAVRALYRRHHIPDATTEEYLRTRRMTPEERHAEEQAVFRTRVAESEQSTGCAKCGGVGFMSMPTAQGSVAVPCSCLADWDRAQRMERMWPLVRLPDTGELAQMSFASWRRREGGDLSGAMNAAREMSAGEGPPILILSGPPGTGKTHLLVSIVRALHERGVPAKFISAVEFYAELRMLMNDGAATVPDAWLQTYAGFPMLALDDLGVERVTGWVEEQRDRLIDARWRLDLPTAISTNVAPSALGERVADRLLDRRKSRVFLFNVPSYRRDSERKERR